MKTPRTLEDAQKLQHRQAELLAMVTRESVKADRRISRIKAELEDTIDVADMEAKEIQEQLETFCRENPELFQERRKVKTPAGVLGLHLTTEVAVKGKDDEKLIAELEELGLDEAVKVEKSLRRPVLKALLERGEKITRARLRSYEAPVAKIASQILEAAKEGGAA